MRKRWADEPRGSQAEGQEDDALGHLSLNISKLWVICMPEPAAGLVDELPYESDADMTNEEIVEGLMKITALSFSDLLADEPTYE
jgi:hypothetical protein